MQHRVSKPTGQKLQVLLKCVHTACVSWENGEKYNDFLYNKVGIFMIALFTDAQNKIKLLKTIFKIQFGL